MPDELAVEFKDVYEKYDLEIKTEGKTFHESFEALKGISFSVSRGESLAIIGPNGAGKSTILRLLAGLLRPEQGEVKAYGRVSSLLDLGAGFHAELTGRDNLLLNASLYNFSREEIVAKLEQILAFADIGKFIDVPVRCYSQGMYVRLAFSLAIHVDPQILLIDDCLAVGDDNFRIKSFDKVLEFKEKGKTIVFVTHDFGAAKQLCKRGLYLREGKILKDGDIDEVVACYVKPLNVDRERYKYLSEKISEEDENRQKQEAEQRRIQEENLRKELTERLKEEAAVWREKEVVRRQKEAEFWDRQEEARQKDASEEWNKKEEERRRAEIEKWSEQEARQKVESEEWNEKEKARQRSESEKWSKQEERQKAESDAWNKKEADRRLLEAETWNRQEETRRKTESEEWNKKEEERRRSEAEKWTEQEARQRSESEKWSKQEERQKAESDAWNKKEAERRLLEAETWNRQEEARQKVESEEWNEKEGERRRSEAEKWTQQEERRKAESEEWHKKEEIRRRNESEKWSKQEERQKSESDAWNAKEAERRQKEAEAWNRQEAARQKGESDAWNAKEAERRQKEAEAWNRQEAARQKAMGEAREREEAEYRKSETESWEKWIKQEAERRQSEAKSWDRREEARRQSLVEEWNKKEREDWDKKEMKRRQALVEDWSKLEEVRRKAESEEWNAQEEQRRRLQGRTWSGKGDDPRPQKPQEVRPVAISGKDALRLDIAPCKVWIFHHQTEITCDAGLRAIFSKNGTDVSSSAAVWRIRKLSDSQVVCFLRWPKPVDAFQIWRFTILPEGAIELEIIARVKDLASTGNERVECCLGVAGSILDEEHLGNKSKVFCLGKSGIRFETLDNDKICEMSPRLSYFLTVRDYDEKGLLNEKEKRRTYFRGRFSSKKQKLCLTPETPLTHRVESGRAKILFREGSCQLVWDQKVLTAGFGLYTSLYSQGMWFDSTRAKWKVRECSKDRLVVVGLWPWKPVSQTWEIVFKDEKNILLSYALKVSRETEVNIQETVLMLGEVYKSWRADNGIQDFPKGFTGDDFFRVCPWAALTDGKNSVSALSKGLPGVTFKPSVLAGHRLVVENAAHIKDTNCRLFHCLRVNKGKEAIFPKGEYGFFKGLITINEEERV